MREYLKDKNGARAARDAGYSKKVAREIAAENLAKPYIKAEIDKGLAEQAVKSNITAQRIIDRIGEFAFHKKTIKPSDSLKACELLGKHFNIFTESLQVSGKDGGPVVVLTMPANGSEKLEEGPT